MAKDFHKQMFHISHIPFFHFVQGKKEPEELNAALFYVHHAQRIDEINPKLETGGCRPINDDELRELLRMQGGILKQFEFSYILATDPAVVKEHPDGKVVWAIEKRDNGEMVMIKLLIRYLIADHAGIYVAAVKKE